MRFSSDGCPESCLQPGCDPGPWCGSWTAPDDGRCSRIDEDTNDRCTEPAMVDGVCYDHSKACKGPTRYGDLPPEERPHPGLTCGGPCAFELCPSCRELQGCSE